MHDTATGQPSFIHAGTDNFSTASLSSDDGNDEY